MNNRRIVLVMLGVVAFAPLVKAVDLPQSTPEFSEQAS